MSDAILGDFPVDDLIDAMIPVYQRHLSKGEVDALVAFYSAPTGQKILKEMPAMTAEAMEASSGIAKKMMAKAMQQVQDQIVPDAKAKRRSEGVELGTQGPRAKAHSYFALSFAPRKTRCSPD